MSAADDAGSPWSDWIEKLLQQALDEAQSNSEAIPTVDLALHALRAEAGELPEDETASLAASLADLFREAVCICPPDLVARGSYRGGCPVHSLASPPRR
jgi:hypothetical protein